MKVILRLPLNISHCLITIMICINRLEESVFFFANFVGIKSKEINEIKSSLPVVSDSPQMTRPVGIYVLATNRSFLDYCFNSILTIFIDIFAPNWPRAHHDISHFSHYQYPWLLILVFIRPSSPERAAHWCFCPLPLPQRRKPPFSQNFLACAEIILAHILVSLRVTLRCNISMIVLFKLKWGDGEKTEKSKLHKTTCPKRKWTFHQTVKSIVYLSLLYIRIGYKEHTL